MNQNLVTLDDTQDLVKLTLEMVTKAVTATMGPNGRLALIGVGTSAKVTKDGVTVAKAIKFPDPRMELINRIITEPAVKTDVECGDGTTTTIFLTHQLYTLLKEFPSFKDQRVIEGFINQVIQELSENSIKVSNDSPILQQLALTSSNNDEKLSELVTQIYRESGDKFPEIEIKEGIDNTDRISRSKGLPLQMSFSNPGFSKNGNGDNTEYQQPIVIVIDSNIRSVNSDVLWKALKRFKDDEENTYLIVARSFDNDVNVGISQINNLVLRKQFIPVQTNMGGSVGTLLMQDLATLFNTPLLKAVEEIEVTQFENSDDVVTVGNSRSLLEVESVKTKARIAERVDMIQSELNDYEGGERFSHRARFNETRMRNLKGELVTIFVGGETISDVKERVDRFEDVIKAVKSALINGVLPGMGTALMAAGLKVVELALDDLDRRKSEDENTKKILVGLLSRLEQQYVKLILTSKVSLEDLVSTYGKRDYVEQRICVNLTTDEMGSAWDLGIYDTAYASITALKGGFKTAKILAGLETILLGDKLGVVQIN